MVFAGDAKAIIGRAESAPGHGSIRSIRLAWDQLMIRDGGAAEWWVTRARRLSRVKLYRGR
jgi:hypothetical protein